MKTQLVMAIYATLELPPDEAVAAMKKWWDATKLPPEIETTDFYVDEVYEPEKNAAASSTPTVAR